MSRWLGRGAWVLAVAGTSVLGSACGGSKKQASVATPTPTAQAPYGQAPPGQQPAYPQQPPPPGAPPAVGKLEMNGSAQSAYQKGIASYAAGDLAGAKAAFQQAVSSDAKAYQAHYSLGVVSERLGDANALSAYRQASTIKADYEPAILAYALFVANKGSIGEAETYLNGKMGQLPNSAGVTAALAEIKSMQRDTASAQRLAQEALKKNSDYRPAMMTIARDHYRNRRLDLALYALQAILDGFGADNPPRDKDNADAHFLRGLILKEEGRRAAAINEFKLAVTLRPDLVAARVELAAYYLEAGNAAEAQPLLEGALRYDTNNVIAHLNLGDCYRLASRIPEAKAQFDWVLAHDTSLAQVHYDLGLLYLFAPSIPGMDAKRQTDEAIAEINKYQQMRGKLAAGQSDDSEELLNRAKQKQADIQAQASAKAPMNAPAPAASSAGKPPAASPAAKPPAGKPGAK
ncbi:MAG TPA: tetratricopeptide repeat protein [Polyangiaceae bacterium]|nr:tetratricopeptide repeat protein [Polyangiaceae bacterium]